MSKTAEEPRGGVPPASGEHQKRADGVEGNPWKIALGVLLLFALAAWGFWDLDRSAIRSAERRAHNALIAQHQELLKAQATCSRLRARGTTVTATETDEACAEVERAQQRLNGSEVAYRRACSACASVERCEDEVRGIGGAGAIGSPSPPCR